MITREEILKGKVCPKELEGNISILLERINKVREAYSRPMIVTSGFRDFGDMKRIYKSDNFPHHSKHLTCEAVDIYDPEGDLKNWIMKNLDFIESIGFWFEDFSSCPNWTHFQIVPPASNKRFFSP